LIGRCACAGVASASVPAVTAIEVAVKINLRMRPLPQSETQDARFDARQRLFQRRQVFFGARNRAPIAKILQAANCREERAPKGMKPKQRELAATELTSVSEGLCWPVAHCGDLSVAPSRALRTFFAPE
jgi:hypothetical protein